MRKRILLVENESFMAEYLDQVLTSVGYTVRRCSSSFEAWAELVDESVDPPDLVLCDMSLETKTAGLDLLRSLSTLPRGQRLPFAVVSAAPRFELLEGAARLGAGAYLIKPVEPARLLRTVDHLLFGPGTSPPRSSLRLLSLDEVGFRIALSLGAFSGAGVQLYNLILKELRLVPPRFSFLNAEHDPLAPDAYLVSGVFHGLPHEARDLSRAWREGRGYEHGI